MAYRLQFRARIILLGGQMSTKAGSLSIVLVATATASLMLGAGARAQYGAGDAGKSTQKPASQPAGERGQKKPATQAAGERSSQAKPASGGVKMADKTFMTHASQDGEAEVELARLAQQKAADAQVKAFAQRMETDHTKAGSELRALIAQKGVTIPGGLPPQAVALKNKLDKLQGATFDQAYMRAMVDDHTKAVREFETASKSTDADVKGFAEKTLPTLREHLKMAQDTYKGVSSSMRSSSTNDAGTKAGGNSGTSGTGGTGAGTTGTGSTGKGGTGTGSTGTGPTGKGGTGTGSKGTGSTGKGGTGSTGTGTTGAGTTGTGDTPKTR
jgi:putative membrane protein